MKLALETMPTDRLWALHEEVSRSLAAGLSEEKRALDERLNRLSKPRPGAGFILLYYGRSAIPITLLTHGPVAVDRRIGLLGNSD